MGLLFTTLTRINRTMHRRFSSIALVTILLAPSLLAQETPKSPERWQSEIRKFEEQDTKNPPRPGGVLFIGSSSIRLWNLKESFPNLDAVNRGFGGSYLSDAAHFVDRIVFPHQPRQVVVYAGDNDIAAGRNPEQVVEAYRELIGAIHAELPEARIAFIAIKPSLARWKLVEKMRQANRSIAEIAAKDERLQYIDIDAPMLGPDGLPRPELFRDDGLHLSAAGYKLWTDYVREVLE